MPVRIITADERLSAAHNKTSIAIFGPPGAGKTSLLKTLPADQTVCLDLEAGMKSVQDWPGASIPVRSFVDFRDLSVLIGGPDPAADPNAWYSAQHHQHTRSVYAGSGLEEFLASKSIIFVDSITDLTRQRRRPVFGRFSRFHFSILFWKCSAGLLDFRGVRPVRRPPRKGKADLRGSASFVDVVRQEQGLQNASVKTLGSRPEKFVK